MDLIVWRSAWSICGAPTMSVTLGLSTRAGQILWKDPLVFFLDVIGLAAICYITYVIGLEAERERKAAERSSIFFSLNIAIFSIVTLPSTVPAIPLSRDCFILFRGKRNAEHHATSF